MKNARRRLATLTAIGGLGLLGWSAGCSGSSAGSGFPADPSAEAGAGSSGGGGGLKGADGGGTGTLGGGPGGGPSADGGPATPCTGLQCQQHACPTKGTTTTVSGTVYDPAGKNPLYNVVVYVPNAKVQPLKTGASCDACDSLYTGQPIATALTDAKGHFTLQNAPDGKNIPLVIQIGKWRKQITIPNVTACQDNAQPNRSLTLPKNHTEGDIPKIAISTGGADTLECLLRRVGLDESEYGPGGSSSAGHISIFAGGPASPLPGLGSSPNTSPPGPASTSGLWSSQASLMPYDIVLLSCEGQETSDMNQQALHDYASAGGRVFSSHFHYAWFNTGPYGSENLATWTTGVGAGGGANNINANISTTLSNGAPFTKGQALKDWLGNVGALTNGELPISDARHNADVTAANTPSQAWITADQSSGMANATMYFSFNTPTNAPMGDAGVPNYCGRVVFSDLHVGAASGDYGFGGFGGKTVPSGCASNDLSPQEKALEFMLFDLSSCVTPETVPPAPPPPGGPR